MTIIEAERRHQYQDLPRLMGLMTGDEKHGPAATSTLDALWVLYDRVLRVGPERMDDPERDRFLLSKGHGPMAYYAVLAAKGFVPVELAAGLRRVSSTARTPPGPGAGTRRRDRQRNAGYGPPIAVGTALGLRAQGLGEPRVWVLIGDAELDEGSNHEAIAYAGPAGLDRLHTVVIDNSSASHARPGGIAARFEAAGWSALTVDGRDHEALYAAFTAPHRVARTWWSPGSSPSPPETPEVSKAHPRHPRLRTLPSPHPVPPERAPSMDTMRDRFAPVMTRLLDEDPRGRGRPRRDRQGRFHGSPTQASRSGDQRRYPRTAPGRGGRGPGADRSATRRAHLRQLPRRAAVRTGQAGPRTPGRGRGAGERGRVLDWPAGGFTPHGTRRRGPARHAGRLDRARSRPSGRGRAAAARQAVAAGDDKVYLRLSVQSNARGLPVDGARLRTVREGHAGVVVAVGPMLGAVLAATEGLDVHPSCTRPP